jgi:endonuclease G
MLRALIFIILLSSILSCAVSSELHKEVHYSSESIETITDEEDDIIPYNVLHLPHYTKEDVIIHYLGFSLQYNERHEQADWVAYFLDSTRLVKVASRKDNFRQDPQIASGTATLADYRKSGYDRGHLAPAADMTWSEQAMDESFFFSNMSPQAPSFNRGIWKKLEEQVRKWAENQTLYIVTGPLLEDGLPHIGPNEVSIPKRYYKAMLRYSDNHFEGIAFVLPNESSSKELHEFVLTIDSLERLSSINFFHYLPDSTERRVESNVCIACWFD